MTHFAAAIIIALAIAAEAQAQTAPSNDIRGNSAEQLLDRSGESPTSEILDRQKKKSGQLTAEEAEAKLGSESAIVETIPSEENLKHLRQLIESEPNNLDHYFAFAQMASALKAPKLAIEAYEAMLRLAPNLDRVRLDLAVSYIDAGKLEEAKATLETVLSRQPSEQVRTNIEFILAKIGAELNPHALSGSISVGVNHDSNANSAPAGDAIVIFDTRVPLSGTQRAQEDIQLFGAASVQHRYKPRWGKAEDSSTIWQSDISLYQAEQRDLDSLNLQIVSLKTGPEMTFKESGLKLRPALGYSHISLDDHSYLSSTATELDVEYPLSERVALRGGVKHEWRDFQNAPSVTTYTDRTGSASEANAGLTVLASPTDIFTLSTSVRKERTRRDYLDNRQIGGSVSYLKLLPEEVFINSELGYRSSVYEGEDALISSKTRHDKERSMGLTAGKRVTESLTASIGYQYRDVNSNIINYTYDDHRFSGTISWRF